MGSSRENATSNACVIAIYGIALCISMSKNAPFGLSLSIETLYGFARPRSLIVKIESVILSDILQCVGESPLPKNAISRLRDIIKRSNFDQSGPFHPRWKPRMELIDRYHLYEVPPFEDRAKLVWPLEQRHFHRGSTYRVYNGANKWMLNQI